MPNFNRYFLRDFQKSKELYSATWSKLLAFELILILFAGAAFSFYWFLLQPLIRSGVLLSFSSPQLYLAILWGVGNFIALFYIWTELMGSSSMASKARRQKEQLGRFLFEVESELQERLPKIIHERWSVPEKSESEDIEVERGRTNDKNFYFRRRMILWELYDFLLDMKDRK